MSLNDDGKSNVLEGIRNLELLTNLRETRSCVLFWSLPMYMCLNKFVMAHDENLGRNSDGI